MLFFHKKCKKVQKRIRPNRTLDGNKGFWKVTGGDTNIKKNGKTIGYKQTLEFYEEKRIKSKWKMHEFHIDKRSYPPDTNCSSESQKEVSIFIHNFFVHFYLFLKLH